jgi:hypothetical protein
VAVAGLLATGSFRFGGKLQVACNPLTTGRVEHPMVEQLLSIVKLAFGGKNGKLLSPS